MQSSQIVERVFRILGIILPLTIIAAVQQHVLGYQYLSPARTEFWGVFALLWAVVARNLGFAFALKACLTLLSGGRLEPGPRVSHFYSNLAGWTMLSSHVMATIGVIQVMVTLTKGTEALGSGLAQAVASYVYGAILAIVLPQSPQAEGGSPTVKASDGLVPGLAQLFMIFVMLFAMANEG